MTTPDTAITAPAMERSLRAALTPTALQVIDESHLHAGHAGANGTGFGTHFRVRIASPLLAGLSRVRQHRLVYDALQEFIDRGAHAIAIDRGLLEAQVLGGGQHAGLKLAQDRLMVAAQEAHGRRA